MINSVGLRKGKWIFKGDIMFIENIERTSDVVCSCDTPCWRAESWDITDVKGGKVPNLLSG
jgi:hypothetical protein